MRRVGARIASVRANCLGARLLHANRPSMGPSSLRILTSPASDTSDTPTVTLQWDAVKYMINAGEGTTRSSAQRRSSNTKVENVFLTRVASETMGGLPGLLMTLADGGRTSLDVHGPPNLRYALATTRFYAKRDTMRVGARELSLAPDAALKPCFEDANLAVYAVPLLPEGVQAPDCAPFNTAADTTPPSAWTEPSFNPRRLHGADADRWYANVIADAWCVRKDTGQASPSAKGATRSAARLPSPQLPPAADGRQTPVLSYICAGHAQRGKFDVQKASTLGIAPGPDFSRLSRGESVRIQRPAPWDSMTEAQRSEWLRSRAPRKKGGSESAAPSYPLQEVEICPSDIMGTTRAGPVFIYMHVPSLEYVESLIQNPAFARYTWAKNAQMGAEQRITPHAIMHAAPREVIEDARYQAWMHAFGPECYHVVANRDHCADTLMFTSSAANLLRLSRLDAGMFPVPGYRLEPAVQLSASMARHQLGWTPGHILPATADLGIGMHPRAAPGLLDTNAPVFNFPLGTPQAEHLAAFAQRGSDGSGADAAQRTAWARYCKLADEVQKSARHASLPARTTAADNVSFVTLGTGSSSPSKYRNVLSTLVHIPDVGYVLLDAGESTYAQLARCFGPGTTGWDGAGPGVEGVLRNLRMIFVSHIHGDHHMGVARILLERRKLRPAPGHPLYLFSNNYSRYYLQEYDELEHLGFRDADNGVVAVDNTAIDWKQSQSVSPQDAAAVAAAEEQLHLASLASVPVVHRTSHCYGLVLAHRDNWSLVFSGDTMPCEALVQAGRGATLLIHEATMQDDEQELAQAKGHSTIGQALDVAAEMDAAHVLLTHFSQRYPKLARIGAKQRGKHGPHVGIAFDQMRVTTAGIRRMQSYRPALEQLFDADRDDADEAAPGATDTMAAGETAKRPKTQHNASAPEVGASSGPGAVRKSWKEFEWRYVVLALYVCGALKKNADFG